MKSKFLAAQVMLVAHSVASKNQDNPVATEHQDSRPVVTGHQDSRPVVTGHQDSRPEAMVPV